MPCNASHSVGGHAKLDVKRYISRQCKAVVDDTGLEHSPLTVSKSAILRGGDAKSDARRAPEHIYCRELAEIAAVWPGLPDTIRSAIVAIVRTPNKQ